MGGTVRDPLAIAETELSRSADSQVADSGSSQAAGQRRTPGVGRRPVCET